MKKIIRDSIIILINTLIIIFVLEIGLDFYYLNVDKKQLHKATTERATSGAYKDMDSTMAKGIQEELLILDIESKSFIHYRLSEFKGTYTNINKEGHRKTKNFNQQKDTTNRIKIFCFGGSTMFSVGARDEYTIPSELSKLIYKSFPNLNIEITNFGCHGYTRNVENIQLQQQLLKNNVPDIVIFYDGVNEVYAAYQNNKAGTIAGESMNKINSPNKVSFLDKARSLIKPRNIYRFVNSQSAKFVKPNPYTITNPEKLALDVASYYAENVKLSQAYASYYNFTVFNFLQPVIYSKKKLEKSEKIFAKRHKYYKKLYQDSYKAIASDSTMIESSNFSDISQVFNDVDRTIYTDYCHTGEYGNTLVALELFKEIKTLLMKRDSISIERNKI